MKDWPFLSPQTRQRMAEEAADYERCVLGLARRYGLEPRVAFERFRAYAASRPEPWRGAYHRAVFRYADAVRAMEGK